MATIPVTRRCCVAAAPTLRDRAADCSTGSRAAVAGCAPPTRRGADGAHARSRARPRRAVPLSLRHGEVHRLQVLRRRLQRAERQPGGDQLAARRRDRRRLVSRTRTRSYLSMGCNHCLEPTCLEGCPVDAYTKDPVTGIVRHSADACIGCQYCTWNCSYGVPQYNPERGVVGKCDMCHGRLVARPGAGVRQRLPGGRDRDRDRQRRPSGAAVDRGERAGAGLPVGRSAACRRRASRCPTTLPPNARPRRHHARRARASALAAGGDDRADAAVGRRVRDDLVAAAARRGDAPGHRGARVAAGRRARARRVDAAPRASGSRLSRAADVAALVAEPRGAAVHGVLGRRRRLCRRCCGCGCRAVSWSAR